MNWFKRIWCVLFHRTSHQRLSYDAQLDEVLEWDCTKCGTHWKDGGAY